MAQVLQLKHTYKITKKTLIFFQRCLVFLYILANSPLPREQNKKQVLVRMGNFSFFTVHISTSSINNGV